MSDRTSTDERVERVAGALYEHDSGEPWSELKANAERRGQAWPTRVAEIYLKKARVVTAALSAAPVQDGWVRVPREPTREMSEAGAAAILTDWFASQFSDEIVARAKMRIAEAAYRAMVASSGDQGVPEGTSPEEAELQELADGAWGDNPMRRRIARDRLKTIRGEQP